MASNIVKFLIPQADWDSLDHSTYWLPYTSAPAHITQLNGYVLASLQNHVQEKMDMFVNIDGVVRYDDIVDLKAYKIANPGIWSDEV